MGDRMKGKQFFCAFGIGLAVGFLAKTFAEKYRKKSPDSILRNAREKFEELGTVSGSWIYMIPENVTVHQLTYEVYRGGVTCEKENKQQKYEFLADAETGAIIHTSLRDE